MDANYFRATINSGHFYGDDLITWKDIYSITYCMFEMDSNFYA